MRYLQFRIKSIRFFNVYLVMDPWWEMYSAKSIRYLLLYRGVPEPEFEILFGVF